MCPDPDDIEAIDEEDEEDGGAEIPSSPSVTTADARHLLPVHLAPRVGDPKARGGTTLKVKRGPGRPRKVERMPTTSDLEYHALQSAVKEQFINSDPLVQAARNPKADSSMVLKLIREQIAVEAAALHFARLEEEKLGRPVGQSSSRQIGRAHV